MLELLTSTSSSSAGSVVGASTIVIPVLGYFIAEDRIRPWLAELQAWMTQHNAAMMATLLFLLGTMMIGKGIAAA